MRYALALAVVLVGCTNTTVIYVVPDSGVPSDAGVDLGPVVDAGQDAGVDLGPACECSAGACCDGCRLRPSSYACAVQQPSRWGCSGKSVCSGYGLLIDIIYADRMCTGWSAACDGLWVNETPTSHNCDSDEGFPPYARCDMPPDGGLPVCVTGPSCYATTP